MSTLTVLNNEEAQKTLDSRVDNIPQGLDLFKEIERLKKEQNAVIMAHYYQEGDIQDIADVLGDSLHLARAAEDTDADVIVLCGVHFMAETAKILNPKKTVVLPDLDAGCSLADSCPADKFAEFKAKHPDHVVVSYVNTTADMKALSDWCCTSTNAKQIIEQFPPEQKIIFTPDVNLGNYLAKETGRDDMVIWQGSCIVHETFNEKYVLGLLEENPGAKLIAHPECEESILKHAEYIGSTKRLLEFTQSDPSIAFVVATESGILHTMQKASPNKTFIPAAPEVNPEEEGATCGCSACPYMKLNSLEKVYLCLRDLYPRVEMTDKEIADAMKPIERMVSIG